MVIANNTCVLDSEKVGGEGLGWVCMCRGFRVFAYKACLASRMEWNAFFFGPVFFKLKDTSSTTFSFLT